MRTRTKHGVDEAWQVAWVMDGLGSGSTLRLILDVSPELSSWTLVASWPSFRFFHYLVPNLSFTQQRATEWCDAAPFWFLSPFKAPLPTVVCGTGLLPWPPFPLVWPQNLLCQSFSHVWPHSRRPLGWHRQNPGCVLIPIYIKICFPDI